MCEISLKSSSQKSAEFDMQLDDEYHSGFMQLLRPISYEWELKFYPTCSADQISIEVQTKDERPISPSLLNDLFTALIVLMQLAEHGR